MTRVRFSWSVVQALLVLLLIAPGTLSFAAQQFGDFESDAWYFDKYLQREFTFTPLGNEVLVRFHPGTADSMAPGIEQRLGLQVVHPVQEYYHHAHYQLAPGAEVLAKAREIAAETGVISAFPVLVDNDGYTKYVVGHELSVQFAKGLDDVDCRNLISLMGSSVAQDHWTPGYYTITVPEKMTLFETIRSFNDLDEVRFAEFSSIGYDDMAMVPNDTDYPNQQNLNNTGQVGSCVCAPYADHDIRVEGAWDITTGSANVVIAVLDSGADLDHPDLAGNILARGSEDWDFADPSDSVPEDTNGHGTSCSGIAAAVTNNGQGVAGIAHDCQIMPLRLDLTGGVNQNRADALNYAASRIGDFDAMVLSNSWIMSSGSFTAVYNAITAAKTAGCVVLFAAGNGNSSSVAVPADSASCIAVGATSPCDERKSTTSCDGENWWGSDYGPELDICAPGVLIHTTALGGGYTTTFNGTSSACPTAAGVAALILSADPSLTPDQVETILEASARDIGAAGFDNETGWGRIDAEAALLLGATGMGPGFCDDFDRPNSTVVDGWNEQSGNWSIGGNWLRSPGGANDYITFDGSDQVNGCIQVEALYDGAAVLHLAGITARYNSTSNRVMAKLQDNSTAGDFNFYYIYDGGSIVASGAGTFGTNPLLELEYVGPSVNFRVDTNQDGVWDYDFPATVSTLDSGLCGLIGYSDVLFNDYCYGPECGFWTEGTLCESFESLDSTTVGDWSERSGDWSTFGDQLQSEALSSSQYITRDGSYQADGCVTGQAIYGSGSGLRYMGLVARYSDDSNKIMGKLQDNSNSGYFDSYYIYDNNSNISWLSGLNFGTDPIIGLEYSGSSVVFRVDTNQDGTWDYSYPATVSNTGYGFTGASAYQQCYLDDWCFGPDCDSWGGDMAVDFDSVPSTYWANDGNQNLGTYYPGLDFGSTATILEATVYGYGSTGYPYHSFDAVLFTGVDSNILVDINPPTNHVGLWYTSGSGELILEGYNSAGTMLASSVGPYNINSNDYLQVNAEGIDYVMVRGVSGYYVIDDFEWNAGTATVGATFDGSPTSGVVPFSVNMSVVMDNLFATQFRRLAGHIDVTLASGSYFPNWRAGFTNVASGGNYSASWNNTIPALGSVVGNNTFALFAEDVTPAPYNQPPYPPAGHEATDGFVVVANTP